MRKQLSKEVSFTLIKCGLVGMDENGKPTITQLPDEVVLGVLSFEKAQKHVNKLHNTNVTIFHMEDYKETYEMSIEDFIKHADIKEQN